MRQCRLCRPPLGALCIGMRTTVEPLETMLAAMAPGARACCVLHSPRPRSPPMVGPLSPGYKLNLSHWNVAKRKRRAASMHAAVWVAVASPVLHTLLPCPAAQCY